eukprot:663663-Rhodomonas_salina.1
MGDEYAVQCCFDHLHTRKTHQIMSEHARHQADLGCSPRLTCRTNLVRFALGTYNAHAVHCCLAHLHAMKTHQLLSEQALCWERLRMNNALAPPL